MGSTLRGRVKGEPRHSGLEWEDTSQNPNGGLHSEEVVHQTTSVGDGTGEICEEEQEPRLDGFSEDDATKSGNDKDAMGESDCAGQQSARFSGDEDNKEADLEASKDDAQEEECTVESKTTETEEITLGAAVTIPPIEAPLAALVVEVALEESPLVLHAMREGERASKDIVLGCLAIAYHPVAGSNYSQTNGLSGKEWRVHGRSTVESLEQQSQSMLPPGQASRVFSVLGTLSHGVPNRHSLVSSHSCEMLEVKFHSSSFDVVRHMCLT